jgi:two-component system, NarL family, sensor kinase
MRSNERHALSAAQLELSIGGGYKTPTGSEARAAGVVALLACGAVASAAYRTLRRTELAGAAAAAAAAERRRVAADLHDGIAQDLAVICAHGEQIAAAMGEGHVVVRAAQRALACSRDTIAELSEPTGTTPRQLLGALGPELSARFGIAIEVDAPAGKELAPLARRHLSRIVREAVANAVRHGGANRVAVKLAHSGDGMVLRVLDDGRSMRQADGSWAVAGEGFGMRSMRERAAALGGSFAVRRSRAGGTELEVVVP